MLDDLDKNTKNIVIGALIGGAVGLTASLFMSGGRHKNCSSLGKVVNQLGEVIESTRSGKSMMKKAEREVESNENVLLSAIDLAAAGIDLWKKFKKAG
jgi:gas vesicle protein